MCDRRRVWRSRLLPLLAVAPGCHVVFPIEPYDGDGSVGSAPLVFSSPGPAVMPPPVLAPGAPDLWGGYAGSFTVTLAADKPGTTIYYTTDGSAPAVDSPTTTSATTPIPGITISAASTVLQYFAVHSGAESATTTEMITIDSTMAKMNAGYLVTNVRLDGMSPVVIASPGSVLSARANVQAWVQPTCTTCRAQVVYGVDLQDQGCLFDGNPNVHPGMTIANKAFNVTVPTTPGVHEVRIAHIEEMDCDMAKARETLKIRPTVSRIGVIVVR